MSVDVEHVFDNLPHLPEEFGEEEVTVVKSVLATLIPAKTIDEIVWHQIQRLAFHRCAWDRLASAALKLGAEEAAKTKRRKKPAPKKTEFLTGQDQQLAFHENKVASLERELLGTPYVRAKMTGGAQTDFLDRLMAQDVPAIDDGDKVVQMVKPYRPISQQLAK